MIILLIELIGYFFLFGLALMILAWIITTIHEKSSDSSKERRNKALRSVAEKMNSAERMSRLSEIRKKPFLQRTTADNEMESVLSLIIYEDIAKARIKNKLDKENTNSKKDNKNKKTADKKKNLKEDVKSNEISELTDQINKLNDLRQKGILTELDYNNQLELLQKKLEIFFLKNS